MYAKLVKFTVLGPHLCAKWRVQEAQEQVSYGLKTGPHVSPVSRIPFLECVQTQVDLF